MLLNLKITEFSWWFWVVGMFYSITALAGWEQGFYLVMEVLFLHLLHMLLLHKSLMNPFVQTSMVFFIISLTGFWDAGRLFTFLLLGYLLYRKVFSDKCVVLYVVKLLPWNHRRMETIH